MRTRAIILASFVAGVLACACASPRAYRESRTHLPEVSPNETTVFLEPLLMRRGSFLPEPLLGIAPTYLEKVLVTSSLLPEAKLHAGESLLPAGAWSPSHLQEPGLGNSPLYLRSSFGTTPSALPAPALNATETKLEQMIDKQETPLNDVPSRMK